MARPRPIQWLGNHPLVGDALLAAVVTGLAVATLFAAEPSPDYHPADIVATVLVVLASAPIVLRRRFPVVTLGVVTVAQFAVLALGYNGDGWAGVVVALYSVGANVANARPRTAAAVGFMVSANAIFGIAIVVGNFGLGDLVGFDLTLAGAFLLGDNMRRRRERIADLAERAERAEREQELLARERVNEERSRIARELHDVVAHSVSVMVIQAGAARRQLTLDPERATGALEAIEATGREAMQEMRRILGVLRLGDDADAELAPQPSIDSIEDLVASDPSLPTKLYVRGERPTLPAGVELSVYRVVQEALTNVRKHAGRCDQVVVVLAYSRRQLDVVVRDKGRGAAQAVRPTPGHGLIGMRERVSACGGELRAGPARGGGWQVRARFPLTPTAAVASAVAPGPVGPGVALGGLGTCEVGR